MTEAAKKRGLANCCGFGREAIRPNVTCARRLFDGRKPSVI